VEVQVGKLLRGERGEPIIHEGGGIGVLGYVLNQRSAGFETPDTTPEFPMKIEGDKSCSWYLKS